MKKLALVFAAASSRMSVTGLAFCRSFQPGHGLSRDR
jgi:hypothetical protein